MSKIKPFPALTPNPDHVKKIISPPYDVIDTEGARRFAAGNPYSFLHITRSEIDLPKDMSPYDDRVYKKAAENLSLFQEKNYLMRSRESFYIYRQIMNGHAQTGVVALASVEEYLNGKIKKHELTREEKVADRARHADVTSAHAEPVFLVHRKTSGITRVVEQEIVKKPLYDVEGWDGVRHIFWDVKDTQNIAQAFDALTALYIADGHHRSASAARIQRCRYFPVVIFPEDEVRVFEYNWAGEESKRPLSKYSMADIIALADRGGIMPPKSTWFAPKLASGFFVHTF